MKQICSKFCNTKKRTMTMLLAVLLTAMSVLGMAPAALPKVKAAPDGSTAISPDQDEISVLSVVVNVNTETENIFTELILHNNSAEEKEVTFALPKISAGMDLDSLKLKTNNSQDLETEGGVITLRINAGGDAGVSYSYKSRTALSCESTILFDLKPLAAQFSDRIGHLEWTVDMSEYELVLVEAIHPMNYTVADDRISVVLDNFLVSDLLDRVYVSRTTHQDLLLYFEQYEEAGLSGYENPDPSMELDESFEWNKIVTEQKMQIFRFILQHYREWFRDPMFRDTEEYYQAKYDDYIFDNEYYWDGAHLEPDYMPGSFSHYIHNTTSMLDSHSKEMAFISTLEDLFGYLNYMKEGGNFFGSSPAISAQLHPGTPAVYVELVDYPQEVLGKTILGYEHGMVFYTTALPGGPADYTPEYYEWRMEHHYDEFYNCYVSEDVLGRTDKSGYLSEYCYDHNIRIVRLLAQKCKDQEMVQDYLNALKVKAVLRSVYFVTNMDEPFAPDVTIGSSVDFTIGDSEYNYAWIGYCGNKRYPYDTFREDLKTYLEKEDPYRWTRVSLLKCPESMENVWNVPIITMYNGGFYPVQELKNRLNDDPGKGKTIGASIPVDSLENVYIYDGYGSVSVGYLDAVFDHPVPAQMRKERDEALQAEKLKNENLLKVAREELKLPSWEEMGPVRDGGIPLGNSPKVEGDDQITIRSLMVNVDTKTRVVTTELTLHSNKTEDTELTFLLPEVTAGIKRSSLDVKAADGTQVRNVDFKVFLPIEAGKDATLSYTYTTKKVLFDQEEIGVDLSRLASHFNDRIEYFSWNVDLPYYEQILIREVNPDDYTTGDRGISMELKDILMSDYPEGISLVRSTPRTLLDEIRKWEEEVGPDSCYTKEAEFIVDQYPSWLEDPDFRDKIIRDENPDGKDRTAVYTMIHLYLQSHYYKMRSEIFFNAYLEQKDYDDLLEEYAGVGPDENAFYTSQESCANFEALLLGDSDHQNEHSQKVRSDLNKIMTALMEQADPETSSDETETVGTDIDGTEADSTKTPASPTGSPAEDPAPAEKSHLPIIFIIAGFGGILAIIALRVVRKVRR